MGEDRNRWNDESQHWSDEQRGRQAQSGGERERDRYFRDEQRRNRDYDYESQGSRAGSDRYAGGFYGGGYGEGERQRSGSERHQSSDYGRYGSGSDYGRSRSGADYGRAGSDYGRYGSSSDYSRAGSSADYGRYGSSSSYGGAEQDWQRNRGMGRGSGESWRSSDEYQYGSPSSSSYGPNYDPYRSGGSYRGNERDRDYGQYGGEPRERGFFERAKDELRSWFSGEDDDYRRSMHRGRGPRNYTRSDDRIREDVNDRLTDDPFIDASEVDVAVSGCEVTLTGTVDSRSAKRRAEDLAEAVAGVRHVQNNIRVRDARQESYSAGTAGASSGTTTTSSSSAGGRAASSEASGSVGQSSQGAKGRL